jgi:hypothetical protein
MFLSESVAIAVIVGVVCCFALRYARKFCVRARPKTGEFEIVCGDERGNAEDRSEGHGTGTGR